MAAGRGDPAAPDLVIGPTLASHPAPSTTDQTDAAHGHSPRPSASVAPAVPMRYAEEVTNLFVLGLASNFEHALRLMEAALADCPEELWATDLWPDEARTAPTPHGGPCMGQRRGSSGSTRSTRSTTTCPPSSSRGGRPRPFDDHTWSSPNRVSTKPELLGCIFYCRHRVREALDVPTADKAALSLPIAHRHHPMTYGVLVSGLPLHVVEHAASVGHGLGLEHRFSPCAGQGRLHRVWAGGTR